MNKVIVNNKMQTGYEYERTKPAGDLSDLKELYEFEPQLTPVQMLYYGVFGGKYFADVVGTGEYYEEFELAVHERSAGIGKPYDIGINYFKIEASSSLEEWRDNGWINEQDPRGFFEWYCRTYYGRRSEDDERQCRRWRMMQRHLSQLQNACALGDHTCRPRQRQALLHWAYDTINRY